MKLCVDCISSKEYTYHWFCYADNVITISPVTGNKSGATLCDSERRNSGKCGPEGKYYQPSLARKIIAFLKREPA